MLEFIIVFVILVFLISYWMPSLRYPITRVKTKNGTEYLVRDMKDKVSAAESLDRIRQDCFRLKDIVIKEYPDDPRSKRLEDNLLESGTIFTESTPDNQFTSYTKNKGEKIVFCIRQRNSKEELVDHNTMMFVAIHEMGHVISVSVGHNEEFWTNFHWLLKIAVKHRVYSPVDYSKLPEEYCGIMITDNPLYTE